MYAYVFIALIIVMLFFLPHNLIDCRHAQCIYSIIMHEIVYRLVAIKLCIFYMQTIDM